MPKIVLARYKMDFDRKEADLLLIPKLKEDFFLDGKEYTVVGIQNIMSTVGNKIEQTVEITYMSKVYES